MSTAKRLRVGLMTTAIAASIAITPTAIASSNPSLGSTPAPDPLAGLTSLLGGSSPGGSSLGGSTLGGSSLGGLTGGANPSPSGSDPSDGGQIQSPPLSGDGGLLGSGNQPNGLGGVGPITGGIGGTGDGQALAPLGPVNNVVQDPGGTLAGVTPNGIPGLPHLAGDTQPEPVSVQTARTQIFGHGYDQPDIVRMRVLGNTTYLYSYGGTVVMEDGTVQANLADTGKNVNTNGYVNLAEVLAAKPEVILLDHSHFDHTHNLAEIATKTGAPVVTSVGSCGWVKWQAVKLGYAPSKVHCNLLRDARGNAMNDLDSYFAMPWDGEGLIFSAFGTIGHPESPLPGGLTDTVVLVKHTATFNRPGLYPGNLSGGHLSLVHNLKRSLANPPDLQNLAATYGVFDLEGGNYLHEIDYRGFRVVHHGSTGYTNPAEPGATTILNSLASLKKAGPIDVEIGAITEASNFVDAEYFQDEKKYAEAIGAKLFFPTHHYDWFTDWLTNPAAVYYPGMVKTWADGQREDPALPKMCYVTEANYATIWQFNIKDWAGSKVGKAIPITGPNCYTG